MSETVTCTVCGREIGKGPAGVGLAMHGKRHRRQFREAFGRPPRDYQEVREKLNPDGLDPGQTTIWQAMLDDDQQTLDVI